MKQQTDASPHYPHQFDLRTDRPAESRQLGGNTQHPRHTASNQRKSSYSPFVIFTQFPAVFWKFFDTFVIHGIPYSIRNKTVGGSNHHTITTWIVWPPAGLSRPATNCSLHNKPHNLNLDTKQTVQKYLVSLLLHCRYVENILHVIPVFV